jgi:hypothetical protein
MDTPVAPLAPPPGPGTCPEEAVRKGSKNQPFLGLGGLKTKSSGSPEGSLRTKSSGVRSFGAGSSQTPGNMFPVSGLSSGGPSAVCPVLIHKRVSAFETSNLDFLRLGGLKTKSSCLPEGSLRTKSSGVRSFGAGSSQTPGNMFPVSGLSSGGPSAECPVLIHKRVSVFETSNLDSPPSWSPNQLSRFLRVPQMRLLLDWEGVE